MKVTFVSNYLNHHQIPFCEAMVYNKKIEFTFIQIEAMDPERVRMGWGVDLDKYPFAISYTANNSSVEKCKQLILDSDIVIFGGVDDESYIKPRLELGKVTIRYSERIYKEGQWKFISPRGLIKKYNDHVKYSKKDVYLFCAGGYVASDFSLIHAYKNKMYTWGYFPKVYEYSEEELNQYRCNNEKLEILWSGRMIDWKHPEYIISACEKLRASKIDFHFTVIGDGDMRNQIVQEAKEKKLDKDISFVGFVTPDKVREYMRKADMYLFTSDFKEGWGAVLNESMNSGCAVIASSGIGAVPYLVKHNVNGLVYKTGDMKEFEEYVARLAKDKALRDKLGKKAYDTMINGWTPEIAAARFEQFAEAVLNKDNGKLNMDISEGPLSKAPIISPGKGYEYVRVYKKND